MGSGEQKAQMILELRADQAEEARVRRAREVHTRREALIRKKCVPPYLVHSLPCSDIFDFRLLVNFPQLAAS